MFRCLIVMDSKLKVNPSARVYYIPKEDSEGHC
jgi:hypothetical protein